MTSMKISLFAGIIVHLRNVPFPSSPPISSHISLNSTCIVVVLKCLPTCLLVSTRVPLAVPEVCLPMSPEATALYERYRMTH